MRQLREVEPELPAEGGGRGRAVIVDYGERDMVRPGGKAVRRRSLAPSVRRYLVLAAACVLTGSAVWAWTQPRSTAAAASSRGVTAAVATASAASAAPSSAGSTTASASARATPTAAPTAFVRGGWLRRIDVPFGGAPEIGPVGPDGTIYIAGVSAIDRDGVDRPDLMRLDGGTNVVPRVFDVDGTAFGVDAGMIWAIAPNGTLSWTYRLPDPEPVELVLSDFGLFALQSTGAGYTGNYAVLRFDRNGGLVSGWQTPGAVISTRGKAQFIVRPSGSLVVATETSSGCVTNLLSLDGERLTTPTRCWMDLTQTEDGALVGWSCTTGDDGSCATTTIALLDDMARPLPGWPRTFIGAMSRPTVTPLGLFATRIGGGAMPEMEGIGPDGHNLSGWPSYLDASPLVERPDECACDVPLPPLYGNDSLYVESASEIEAYHDIGGKIADWPQRLSSPPWDALYDGDSKSGVVFAALSDRVQAVDPRLSGDAGATFVDGSNDFAGWLAWRKIPGGGVVAVSYHAGNNEAYLLVARLSVSP